MPSRPSVYPMSVRGLMSPEEVDGFLYVSLPVCLSVSPDMLQEATITGVQRTRRVANLPGHLARLTLFKQVPRRLVSCLVKWLTF